MSKYIQILITIVCNINSIPTFFDLCCVCCFYLLMLVSFWVPRAIWEFLRLLNRMLCDSGWRRVKEDDMIISNVGERKKNNIFHFKIYFLNLSKCLSISPCSILNVWFLYMTEIKFNAGVSMDFQRTFLMQFRKTLPRMQQMQIPLWDTHNHVK